MIWCEVSSNTYCHDLGEFPQIMNIVIALAVSTLTLVHFENTSASWIRRGRFDPFSGYNTFSCSIITILVYPGERYMRLSPPAVPIITLTRVCFENIYLFQQYINGLIPSPDEVYSVAVWWLCLCPWQDRLQFSLSLVSTLKHICTSNRNQLNRKQR